MENTGTTWYNKCSMRIYGKKKRTAVTVIGGIAICAALVLASAPALLKAKSVSSRGVVSNNIHENDYSYRKPVADCYIAAGFGGCFSRVENMGDIILVEDYNASMKLTLQHFVPMELTHFGGFYSGAQYNYFLFGQNNPGLDNNLEVLRVVKYGKDWTRLGACSVRGCNTQSPFYGCNTDFAEYGNRLFIRCGHMAYNGQQAAMSLQLDSAGMGLIQVQCDDAGAEYGSARNTAATYIDAADGRLFAADHSLDEPRGMTVVSYGEGTEGNGLNSFCYFANTMPLAGNYSDPTPQTSIGGLKSSGQYAILVGSTAPQDGSSANRNVFVATVPKNAFSTENVRLGFLTGYAYGDPSSVMTPYLVKVDNDDLVVIWECRNGFGESGEVNFVYINGAGQMTSQVKKISGCLSDCEPVLVGNQIVWYTTDGSSAVMYSIPAYNSSEAPTAAARAAVVYDGVNYSSVFDYSYYTSKYPDVRVLYGDDPSAALAHFVRFGMPEGRQGSDNFNVYAYMNRYADLRTAYGTDLKQYYLHFVRYGADEGRNGR